MNKIVYVLGLLAVTAFVLAGCGSSSDYSGGESSSGGAYGGKGGDAYGGGKSASNSEATGGAGVVSVADVGDLGTILVDSEGRTLYDFHKDKGAASSCYGACAQAWPPLLTEGKPEVKGGASAGMLGVTKRKDGTTQVTYAGHPLYTFSGDKGPGEANGNDVDAFGAEWYALQPSGQEPED